MTEANPALIELLPKVQLHQVVLVPISYLRTAEYNPRTINEENLRALKESLTKNRDFLQVRPPIVNVAPGREGIVIGGNQRLMAANELGWEKIPVMFVMAETIEKEKAYNLLDNKNSGQWDGEKLTELVMDLHNSGYDLTSISHTPTEIADIMAGTFNMGDPTDTDEYKENGTTPGKKWVECPECHHQFKVTRKVKIDPPEDESTSEPEPPGQPQ